MVKQFEPRSNVEAIEVTVRSLRATGRVEDVDAALIVMARGLARAGRGAG